MVPPNRHSSRILWMQPRQEITGTKVVLHHPAKTMQFTCLSQEMRIMSMAILPSVVDLKCRQSNRFLRSCGLNSFRSRLLPFLLSILQLIMQLTPQFFISAAAPQFRLSSLLSSASAAAPSLRTGAPTLINKSVCDLHIIFILATFMA